MRNEQQSADRDRRGSYCNFILILITISFVIARIPPTSLALYQYSSVRDEI